MADGHHTEEIWLPVVSYEGIYEVSNRGRVRSVDRTTQQLRRGVLRTVKFRGRDLKQFQDKDGYLQVKLCGVGRARSESVHRIVCRAFNGAKPSDAHEVAHNDGDKKNNIAGNLRWATKRENQSDRSRHGTGQQGENGPRARLTQHEASEIKRRSNAGEPSGALAKEYKISKRYVREIATGTKWKSLGAVDGKKVV